MWNAGIAALSGSAYGLAFVALGSDSFYAQAGIIGAMIVACIVGDVVMAARTEKSSTAQPIARAA